MMNGDKRKHCSLVIGRISGAKNLDKKFSKEVGAVASIINKHTTSRTQNITAQKTTGKGGKSAQREKAILGLRNFRIAVPRTLASIL